MNHCTLCIELLLTEIWRNQPKRFIIQIVSSVHRSTEWCCPGGHRAPTNADAQHIRAVQVPACPRSRLTSPCFLILMTINRFCCVSALKLEGSDRKRGGKVRESEWGSERERERTRACDREFLTADKQEKEIQFTAQIGSECVARWWWLGPWLHCPYLCLPRHITSACLRASRPPCYPEESRVRCAPLSLCPYQFVRLLQHTIM